MKRVLLSFDQIQRRILEMGKQIATDYAGREPHLVGVLKGACPFMTDLAQAIELPLTLDYIAVSSYGKATKSSGEVKLVKDLDQGLARHVPSDQDRDGALEEVAEHDHRRPFAPEGPQRVRATRPAGADRAQVRAADAPASPLSKRTESIWSPGLTATPRRVPSTVPAASKPSR